MLFLLQLTSEEKVEHMLTSQRKARAQLENAVSYLILGAATIAALFPLVWMILMSFKTRVDVFTIPPPLFFNPTLDNYFAAFVEKNFTKYLINSLVVVAGSTIIAVSLGSLAAYSFSRFKMWADKHILFDILTFRMAPLIVFIIPFYMIWTNLGMYDTHIGLIIAHAAFNMPLVVWLMLSFFDGLPRDLEEAAMVDGCSRLATFFRIVLPLVAPGLAASAVICIIFSWNEFFFAMVLTSVYAKTLPAAITGFVTTRGTLWGEMAAVATVIIVPVLTFAIIVQKYLVRGLTFGAIK